MLELNKVYCGDCLDLMRQMSDGEFDLALVDPPYGTGIPNQSTTIHSLRNFKRVERTGGGWFMKYDMKIKNWDVSPATEYFEQLFRVSKYQIIWGGNYFSLPPSRNFIVWVKKTISEKFSMASCEYAWTNIPGNAKYFEYHPQDPERFHPTQKPVALYKWLLYKYAQKGWRILDTHAGSFTTAIACEDMGFDYTCIELDKEYYKKGIERIRQFKKQKLLFDKEALNA